MFAKIFTKILDSSLADNPKLRHLFMDLLLLADMDGTITQTESAIARRINCPVDDVTEGIRLLCLSDGNSQSDAEDGRRLIPLEGARGWLVVNYQQYRETRCKEDERARTRERVRLHRQRAKEQQVVKPVTDVTDVTQCNDIGEGDAKADTKKKKKAPQPPKGELPFVSDSFKEAWQDWEQHRKEKRKPITNTARKRQLAKLKEMGEEAALATLIHSTTQGYDGLWPPKAEQGQPTPGAPKSGTIRTNPKTGKREKYAGDRWNEMA
jgi:hypothetical protein